MKQLFTLLSRSSKIDAKFEIMKRCKLIALFLCISSMLFSQDLVSTKIPVFKTTNSAMQLLDAKGNEIISMPFYYKKYKDSKAQQKIITVKEKQYLITKRKGKEKVFNEEMEQVAAFSRDDSAILLFENFTLLRQNTKSFFNANSSSFINVDGKEVVSIKRSGQIFQMSISDIGQDDAGLLLTALSLHQHVECMNRKTDNQSYVSNALFTN